MSKCGCSGKIHAHAVDPTHTLMIRRRYEAEVYKRFRRLKGRILDKIVEQDGFGLKTNRDFAFTRTDQKISAFMEWLNQAQAQDILEVVPGTPISQAASQSWQSTYVRSAYQRGIQNATNELKAEGVDVADSYVQGAFFRPIHADRLGLAFTRNFTELKGITEAMDQQISRVLAQGLAEGRNPLDIARTINNRVDKIGITRARMLARTEVIRSHTMANVAVYREAGIEGVKVRAEFTTAGDSRVCPECESLEGEIFTLDEIERIIPVHPNCRCQALPVVQDPNSVRLS